MSYPHVIRLRGPWDFEPLVRFAATDTLIEPADPSSPAPRLRTATPTRTGESTKAQPPGLPAAGRAQLPADWGAELGQGFYGRVRYTRRFNRPTNLDPSERVWMVIDGVDARGDYAINGHKLGTIDGYALPSASDITSLLAPSNVLEIEIELQADVRLGPPHPLKTGQGEESPQPTSSLDGLSDTTLRPGRAGLAGGPIGDVRLEIRADAHVEGLTIYCEPSEPTQLCVRGEVKSEKPGERLSIVVTACEYEVAFAEVIVGETFALTAPADDWPSWPDMLDEPVLTPIEVRLLRGATAIWQTVVETAPPQADDANPRRAMLVYARAGDFEWLDFVDEQAEVWQGLLSRPGTIIGVRAILPEASYKALDRANVAVVQQVPRAWAPIICRRLAHHPSIIAWSAANDERTGQDAARASVEQLNESTCGRPWIASP
ncbi:MAG TPA: hypothetical protein VGG64_02620 [Pirellulales bacterium]|jgi:hypothetical protein